jgi:hypothetical protein
MMWPWEVWAQTFLARPPFFTRELWIFLTGLFMVLVERHQSILGVSPTLIRSPCATESSGGATDLSSLHLGSPASLEPDPWL